MGNIFNTSYAMADRFCVTFFFFFLFSALLFSFKIDSMHIAKRNIDHDVTNFYHPLHLPKDVTHLYIYLSYGPIILHRNCVAVPIYINYKSAANHRSITAFQVKMHLTSCDSGQCSNIACLCSAAMQRNCGVVWTDP